MSGTTSSTSNASMRSDGVLLALHELRSRGVDDADEWVERLGEGVVLRTCHWWDKQRNAGAGLLAWKLRQGGVEDLPDLSSKQAELRRVYETFADPVGAVTEAHADLASRLERERGLRRSDCRGSLVVVERIYPLLTVECDGCGEIWAYTVNRPRGEER